MPRKPPRRTRERILETALALFNRDGVLQVTTGHIADEMNISPGNLYYHFRSRDDIIGELCTAFEANVLPLLAGPSARGANVEDLWLFLHLLFERMWQHRFFCRDLDAIVSRDARLAARLARVTQRSIDAVIELCRGLRAARALHATDDEIAALATSVVIITTYWMSFQRLTRPAAGIDADPAGMHFERGAAHVLALLAPYMSRSDRAHVERLAAGYLAIGVGDIAGRE